MTIEQKVFSHMRFSTKRLAEYGFENRKACYYIEKDFMDGDFTAEIMVYEKGTVRGRGIDNMNEEEYIPLRMPNYNGAFVGSVRAAYEELLTGETQERLHDLVKAADKLSAYIKCIEERRAGNDDFLSAERSTRRTLEEYHLPEVDYFLEHFIPAFELTLDELGTIED